MPLDRSPSPNLQIEKRYLVGLQLPELSGGPHNAKLFRLRKLIAREGLVPCGTAGVLAASTTRL